MKTKGILAASGVPLPLMKLESMPAKPREGGDSTTASHGKLRRLCAILHMQIRPTQILLRTKKEPHEEEDCLVRDLALSFDELHQKSERFVLHMERGDE